MAEKLRSSETAEALALADRAWRAAYAMSARAEFQHTEPFNQDPRVLALAILMRSISNYRGTMALVKTERQWVEAKVLIRLLAENVLFLGRLASDGKDFSILMGADESHNRRRHFEEIKAYASKVGEQSSDSDFTALRDALQEAAQALPDPKRLDIANVAKNSGDAESAYFYFKGYSQSAVHCTFSSLGRHVSAKKFTVEPIPHPGEAAETLYEATLLLWAAADLARSILGFVQPLPPEIEASKDQLLGLRDRLRAGP